MASGLIKEQRKTKLLAAFSKLGILGRACEQSGVGRDAHVRWLKEDPEYAARFEQAKWAAVETLEKEMIRRGRDGYDEPVYYEGEVVGSVKKYSDTLLIFALKGWAPDKYRERLDIRGQHSHVHLHAHRLGANGETLEGLGSADVARILGTLTGPTGGQGLADSGADSGSSPPQP